MRTFAEAHHGPVAESPISDYEYSRLEQVADRLEVSDQVSEWFAERGGTRRCAPTPEYRRFKPPPSVTQLHLEPGRASQHRYLGRACSRLAVTPDRDGRPHDRKHIN